MTVITKKIRTAEVMKATFNSVSMEKKFGKSRRIKYDFNPAWV